MSTLFVPRAYQPAVIKHIQNVPRCACWVDMGLGKTVSTLTALDFDLAMGGGPVLVIAPLRVAKNVWGAEAAKWDHLKHLRTVSIVGNAAERKRALHTSADIYTINYDNLPWLVAECGDRWPFRIVVSDEATRLKGFRLKQGGTRTKALGQVAHTKIERFIELTGTPAPNGLIDLWGQMWFLDGGKRLGHSHQAFMDRWFCLPHKNASKYEPRGDFVNDEIHAMIRDLVVTVRAEDYFDLEAPIVTNIEVEMPVSAMRKYRELEKEMFIELKDTIANKTVTAVNMAALTNKCLQLANGAVYVDEEEKSKGPRAWLPVHDAKIEALRSIVEETNGAPLLVSYEFQSDLARLKRAFPQAVHLDSKKATEDRWNEGKIPMLLAHPASAGHGLNLQHGGNRIVFFGHSWNLELYQQINERLGPVRQMQSGYKRSVFIYHIITAGTLDYEVMVRRQTKRDVQDLLLEKMNGR
jgi:SNF2 family DNA or RNA helicase